MTGETENLVLELLRGMRADTGAVRSEMEKRFSVVETRLASVDERSDAVDTHLDGIRTVLVASIGSVATDLKDHETRSAALEGTPA